MLSQFNWCFNCLLELSLAILEIWYPILYYLYLSSLISYRKLFILQTELWISSFKWIMSQPSNLVAREIKQKLKRKFSEFFWPTLYNSFQFSIHISISWKSNLTNWPTDYLTVFQKPLYIILIINLSKPLHRDAGNSLLIWKLFSLIQA